MLHITIHVCKLIQVDILLSCLEIAPRLILWLVIQKRPDIWYRILFRMKNQIFFLRDSMGQSAPLQLDRLRWADFGRTFFPFLPRGHTKLVPPWIIQNLKNNTVNGWKNWRNAPCFISRYRGIDKCPNAVTFGLHYIISLKSQISHKICMFGTLVS